MQKQDQIADLFKETFENYEAPVRSGIWENVASRIETAPAPSPDSSVTSHAVTGASKITGSLLSWVGGAVLVASIGTGIYFYEKKVNTPAPATTANIPAEKTNTITDQQQEVVPSPSQQQNQPASSVAIHQSSTGRSADIQTASQNSISNPENLNPVSAATEANHATTSVANHESSAGSTAPENSVSRPVPVTNNNETNSNNSSTASDNTVIKHVIDAQPASGTAPLQVSFNATPVNASAEWIFGDGTDAIKGNNVQHEFTQPGNYLVTLKTTDENGITHQEIKRIEVQSDLTVTVPDIFTPNGDGLNDVFSVKAAEGVEIKVIIFDKSGKQVYKYTGADNSWNGKINNNLDAEAGTYFYVIFATGSNGAVKTQQGTITLKR